MTASHESAPLNCHSQATVSVQKPFCFSSRVPSGDPVPFHEQECFAQLGPWPAGFPEAERAARESLALPVFGELSDDQLRYVVDSLVAIIA